MTCIYINLKFVCKCVVLLINIYKYKYCVFIAYNVANMCSLLMQARLKLTQEDLGGDFMALFNKEK